MPESSLPHENLYGAPQDAFRLLQGRVRTVHYEGETFSLVTHALQALAPLKRDRLFAYEFLVDRLFLVGFLRDGKYSFLFPSTAEGHAFRAGKAFHTLSSLSVFELQDIFEATHRIEPVSKSVEPPLIFGEDLKGNFQIVGLDPGMKAVAERVRRVAPTDVTVILFGETGTGKELFARAIHELSQRSDKPFLAVNCSAMQDTLLESELFGHERGAFTDAKERKIGKFELAHGGTLFLDEIGDMSLAAQAKVLRALDQREITRVGGREVIPIDIRIIAATNKDLSGAVAQKLFRQDLYYRIAGFPIQIPPLRERKDDIPYLLDFFLVKHAQALKRIPPRISGDLLRTLVSFCWPGNIRQLEHMVHRALVLHPHDKELSSADFDVAEEAREHPDPAAHSLFQGVTLEMENAFRERGLSGLLESYELWVIREVLEMTGGNKSKAAEILGISRPTLHVKLGKAEKKDI